MGRIGDARRFDRLELSDRLQVVRERLQALLVVCLTESRHYGDLRERIEPLLHDQLSLLEIPGGARAKNFIFAMSPVSGPLAGRDVMAFVSLLRSERIEVRIIAGSGQNACDPDDCAQIEAGGCDYFGVFSLRREDM